MDIGQGMMDIITVWARSLQCGLGNDGNRAGNDGYHSGMG